VLVPNTLSLEDLYITRRGYTIHHILVSVSIQIYTIYRGFAFRKPDPPFQYDGEKAWSSKNHLTLSGIILTETQCHKQQEQTPELIIHCTVTVSATFPPLAITPHRPSQSIYPCYTERERLRDWKEGVGIMAVLANRGEEKEPVPKRQQNSVFFIPA